MKRTKPKRRWTKLEDDSPMPWGKYAGTKMGNVPADYLLWLDKQGYALRDVKEYIDENMDALLSEVEEEDD